MNCCKKMAFIALALFIIILPTFSNTISENGQTNPAQNSELKIMVKHFSVNRRVIPLYYKNGKLHISSIKLPDIVITNNSDKPQRLDKITIVAKANGVELAVYQLSVNDMNDLSTKIIQNIKILQEANELIRLKELFGEIYIPQNGFTGSNEIQPGESYLAPLSRLLFVHYIGYKKADEIILILKFIKNAVEKKIEFPVVLTHYQTKGKYIFPVRGSINIVNLPTNFVQHRASTYQEFAIDIWDIRLNKNSLEYTISTANPALLSDYYIYHREVIAPADGVVTEVGDKFPEELMRDPANFSAEYFQKLRKELTPKIGFQNFVRGNYIIIDHKNGEYSFYGHLSEGSIRVKKGDNVKQGEVIAKVGNTGHSDAPHLHFHLMDSPNCYEANGLPITFENVPITTAGMDISDSNSMIHSDFLNIFLPENAE